jgi:hypothetical protein
MQAFRISAALLLTAAAQLATAAPAPAPAYDSAFSNYKKYEEPRVTDWKHTNAAIAASPGHSGHGAHGSHAAGKPDEHAGHDMKPAAAPTTKTSPPAKPDPHAGHKH